MHPILREFIYTDERLANILENNYNSDQFLETVFLKLTQAMGTEKVDNNLYIELDQAIVKGHPEPSVYLIFVSFAIVFTNIRYQFERSRVIQSIGSSLTKENIYPEVQAYFMISTASLKFSEKKFLECDHFAKASIALIGKNNPRFVTILSGYGNIVAHQGRLNDIKTEDLEILNNSKDKTRLFLYVDIKLRNSVFTGNFKEGLALIDNYKKLFFADFTYLIEGKINLLKILSGDLNENNYEHLYFKQWVRICLSLINGNYEDANNKIQFLLSENWKEIPANPFEKYLALHLELSKRNKGKSRLLFQDLIEGGSNDYLDDFFLARIQLLENNRDGAFASFDRLIKNINHYDAMNRLIFELQFAKEMKISDIFLLTNGNQNKGNVKSETFKSKESSNALSLEKSVELLVGQSLEINKVKKLIKKFANLKEPILITGETGTGKELAARAIHEEGPHSNENFLAINCGALTESLLQSELFGYEAGAFTGAQKEHKGIFEAAGKGTVFLDEFGDISQKMQVSLLRVLESNEIRLIGGTKTRKIECKIVIATNIDMQIAVEEKKFREDLFFRLTRFDIKLPPLRKRTEDISILITHFLKGNDNNKLKHQNISKNLLDILVNYRWPGNIRELKNEIERLKILHADKEILNVEDFDFSRLQDMAIPMPKHELVVEKIESNPQKFKPNIQNLVLDHSEISKMVEDGTKAEIRQKMIKELFQKYKKFTRAQIIIITSISPVTVTKELQSLCELGFIKKITPTKSVKSYYFILVE